MIDDPITFFSIDLMKGKKLCLLPMARMRADEPVWLAEKLIFYPANSIVPSKLRVVWEPKHELDMFYARNHAVHPGFAEAEGNELHWLKSAAKQVTADELFQGGLLAFPFDMDWALFLTPESHEFHLNLISRAAAHAEKLLNLIRFDYCRIDLPETLPERAGLLENKQFSAALFYTLQDNESYIIAGDVIRQSFVTGLGLEVDGIAVQSISSGEVGNIASHALQMHTDALEAPTDTAKFINLINLIDYLAQPSDYLTMVKAKGQIARHVAKSPAEYQRIIEDFKYLTSLKDDKSKNIGLRHNIIHMGRRLEDILDTSERRDVLIRMNRYAGMVIKDLLDLSEYTWLEVEQLREAYGKALGLHT